MSFTTLLFGGAPSAPASFSPAHTVVLGPRALLGADSIQAALGKDAPGLAAAAAVVADGRDKAAKAWDGARSVTVAELESKRSRNMGAIRHDALHALVQKHVPSKEDVQVNLLLDSKDQVVAAAGAIARALPKFSRKSTTKDAAPRTVLVQIHTGGAALSEAEYAELNTLAGAVRHCAHLVDTPTADLNTSALLREIEGVAQRHAGRVKATTIVGDALREQGLHALWSVGKAASAPPALAVLEYTPAKPAPGGVKLALVGKGIVYDTGGLSIKSTAGMCEMKTDMGGAAALLAAFEALVRAESAVPLVFVGCLAENAVGPNSYRNDDILTGLSGKTIEVNNTDAEGRLVLADGVAYATLHHQPTHVIDMATLTGAQMIATGMHHAGVLSRTQDFEDTVRAAGSASGDWCFPLLYAPEILEKEFESKVADMRNSVKNRANAQSSCAGHFVESHLNPEWKGEWAHVDIAGPSFRDGRATGFGVGLVWELAKKLAA